MFATKSLIDYRNKLAELEKAALNSKPRKVILELSNKPAKVKKLVRTSIINNDREQVLHEPVIHGTLLAFRGYFNRGEKITSDLKNRMIIQHIEVFEVIQETETLEYLGHINHLWVDKLWIYRELLSQGQPLPRIKDRPFVPASAYQYRNDIGGFDYGLRSPGKICNLSVNHYRISRSVFDQKTASISTI
ncbi:MAG: hypothetical protein AAGE84_06750 [Cyanobacteria bacterium P01_G01_bin.39]